MNAVWMGIYGTGIQKTTNVSVNGEISEWVVTGAVKNKVNLTKQPL